MQYFKLEEFKCKCCGEIRMNANFLEKLEWAREIAGIPFKINSGYRCSKHNKEVGSTSDNHVLGVAADIQCGGSARRFIVIDALIRAGFERIGISTEFIHADTNNLPHAVWTYRSE